MLRSCGRSVWRMRKRNEGRSAGTNRALVAVARNTRGVACHRKVNTNEKLIPVALPSVEIYADGGCEPNPGPGGYGVVLLHLKKRAEVNGGFRKTTNNRMEIFAAIAGLEM